MLKIRFLWRLFLAFFARFRVVIAIASLMGIITFVSLGYFAPGLFENNTERIGISGRFTPSTLPESVLGKIGDGLTALDEKGEPYGSLAKEWEIEDSGKRWIFHLANKKWQDGKEVVSDDINYSFTDAKVERPDSKTIVFTLESSFSPFASSVSKPIFKKGLLGTGEWEVKKILTAGNFISEMELVSGKKKIIYRFYPTETALKLSFKLGRVDRIESVFDPKPLDKWKTNTIVKTPNNNQIVTIFFNVKSTSLSEKTLRQALAYAIDKKALSEYRALSPISPDSWAYNSQVKPYDYDLKRAKTLFSELPKESTKDLKITLSTTQLLLPTAETVAKAWESLGIKTEVRVVGGIPSEFEAFLAILDVPNDPDQYSLWHSTQETNISKYQNPRINKLLEDGRLELATQERKKIYLDFQRFLLEDSPAIFLYHPVLFTIERK